MTDRHEIVEVERKIIEVFEIGKQGPPGAGGGSSGGSEPGAAAGFGTPVATVTGTPYGTPVSVAITASGPDIAKVFKFDFNIPAGKDGPTGPWGYSLRVLNINTAGASIVNFTLAQLSPTTNIRQSDMLVSTDGSIYVLGSWNGTSNTGVGTLVCNLLGPPGKSAYQAALDGGYTGTEAQFNAALAGLGS